MFLHCVLAVLIHITHLQGRRTYQLRNKHPTKQQLYGHLRPIMKIIKIRWTRHAGHCWRSRDELISDVPLWTPSRGWATYIQQLCVDTGCSPEDPPEVTDNREVWRERVRDIRADSLTWWWWWWWCYFAQSKFFTFSADKTGKSRVILIFFLCKIQKLPVCVEK